MGSAAGQQYEKQAQVQIAVPFHNNDIDHQAWGPLSNWGVYPIHLYGMSGVAAAC